MVAQYQLQPCGEASELQDNKTVIQRVKMENTKREFSLDFTKPRHTRANQPSLITPILALSTPEITKMIAGDGSSELTVLTPNGISSVIHPNVLPSPLIPTTVNNNNNNILSGNSNCNHSSNSTNSNNNDDGNQNLNQKRSGKSRDIDIEKIEKKRERNRLAAKKCRQRKLETIDYLKKTVSEWEDKYKQLSIEFEKAMSAKDKEIEDLRMDLNELKRLNRH